MKIYKPRYSESIQILKVYNEVGTNTLPKLAEAISRPNQHTETTVLGGFNLHHPFVTSPLSLKACRLVIACAKRSERREPRACFGTSEVATYSTDRSASSRIRETISLER